MYLGGYALYAGIGWGQSVLTSDNKQYVCSTEVVHFLECPLSEVPLYAIIVREERKPWSDAKYSMCLCC